VLRLLYVIQGEQLGGAELHAIDLARRMALRGHHVAIACRPGADAIRRALAAALPPLSTVRPFAGYVELAAAIDELRPQVVQHFNGIVTPAALQTARHRPRSVQVLHANHALEGSTPAPTDASDVLIAVSESAAQCYAVRTGDPPLRVIRDGIDTRHYAPARATTAEGPLRLVAASRLDESAKRTAALVALCADRCAGDWRLAVLGDGPDRDLVERVVRARGLERRVTLFGHVDDPAPCYRASDVFVSLSTSEGFGRALAEAAASGLAIVARHCHGVSDLLERAACAGIAHSDAAFGDRLCEIATDPALRARLGRAARRFAVRELDVEPMVEQYERLYHELVRPGATRVSASVSPA
jgi:glycosyltransferase involved in cell wall biosynthesis